MRVHYDLSRPKFDVVTGIELGELDQGHQEIDVSGKNGRLYSLTAPLMAAMFFLGIPK